MAATPEAPDCRPQIAGKQSRFNRGVEETPACAGVFPEAYGLKSPSWDRFGISAR